MKLIIKRREKCKGIQLKLLIVYAGSIRIESDLRTQRNK